jgi:hypothetical protein
MMGVSVDQMQVEISSRAQTANLKNLGKKKFISIAPWAESTCLRDSLGCFPIISVFLSVLRVSVVIGFFGFPTAKMALCPMSARRRSR